MSWRRELRFRPGRPLAEVDPRATPLFDGPKQEGRAAVLPLLERLDELQLRLFASKQKGLLVVMQGRDAAGKDGVLRKVVGAMTPLGFSARAFGPPTEEEAAHDFLWRVHAAAPGRGQVVALNRSHYEDVLVRRVRRLDPESRWRPRYDHIRRFEQLLHGDGDVVLVKLYLHISPEEQADRLRARLERSEKRWKFRRGDLEDRALWTEYDRAYEEALSRTDADHAPWYVIPADRKWYRDLATAHVLVETLEALRLEYPPPAEDLTGVVVD